LRTDTGGIFPQTQHIRTARIFISRVETYQTTRDFPGLHRDGGFASAIRNLAAFSAAKRIKKCKERGLGAG
jgi:hypothetical protein